MLVMDFPPVAHGQASPLLKACGRIIWLRFKLASPPEVDLNPLNKKRGVLSFHSLDNCQRRTYLSSPYRSESVVRFGTFVFHTF